MGLVLNFLGKGGLAGAGKTADQEEGRHVPEFRLENW
jgi:hypothetical protein